MEGFYVLWSNASHTKRLHFPSLCFSFLSIPLFFLFHIIISRFLLISPFLLCFYFLYSFPFLLLRVTGKRVLAEMQKLRTEYWQISCIYWGKAKYSCRVDWSQKQAFIKSIKQTNPKGQDKSRNRVKTLSQNLGNNTEETLGRYWIEGMQQSDKRSSLS